MRGAFLENGRGVGFGGTMVLFLCGIIIGSMPNPFINMLMGTVLMC